LLVSLIIPEGRRYLTTRIPTFSIVARLSPTVNTQPLFLFDQSSLCSTTSAHLRLGLPRLLSFVTACWMIKPSKAKQSDCRITFYMICYLYLPPHRNITNSDTARIHYNCLNIPHICQIATLLHACYIKTLISYLDNSLIMP